MNLELFYLLMDKTIIEDGMYKVVYKLPSQSILEFDISFKANENFESVLYETFEQEQIPKILLKDLSPIFKHFLNEEKRSRESLSSSKKENLNSKLFLQNCINSWLTMQTFKNHIERIISIQIVNICNNKHINELWQKWAVIKFYYFMDNLVKIEKKLQDSIRQEKEKTDQMEMSVQMNQEKEMQVDE